LVEAVDQLTRARDQIATLRATTPIIRRNQINVQVALANALMHTKGYAAAETQSALENARILIEQAEERWGIQDRKQYQPVFWGSGVVICRQGCFR